MTPDTQIADVQRSRLRSSLVILGMLLLGAATSVAAIWYLRGLSRRSVEFWGPQAGALILQAPQVEALLLAPTGPDSAAEQSVVERRDVSQARGLANVRRALMQDASYEWPPSRPDPLLRWSHALRFTDRDRTTTLLFALNPPAARPLERDMCVGTKKIAAGLRDFFAEHFPGRE
jgi:hypothetical protein